MNMNEGSKPKPISAMISNTGLESLVILPLNYQGKAFPSHEFRHFSYVLAPPNLGGGPNFFSSGLGKND